MKKAKRESVRKIEINHDLVMSARRKTFAINKKADIEIERNTSASKNYRITTNESQRVPSSPSMSIKFKNNAYNPMHRKFSGASDFYKGSRKRLLTIEIKTATNFEDSVSNASYMPDNRSRANKSGELFRHDASDQKSVAQETARKPISQDIRLSLAAPQTNLMLFDRKPSYRTQSKGLGPTESAESIPRSDRTMKPPKSSSGGKQLEINQSNSQMLTRKSQMFSISTSKHQQSPSGREISFGVSQGAPQQSVKVSAASRQPLRMFRRDQVDTSKVIEEAKSYHAIMNAAKKEKFMYSENIDVSQYRTNVLQDKFSKFRTRDVLQKFSFEKKKRVIGNLKEKIGKNRKMIQYEAKVLKSTNTADIGSFRKDLRLVIEEKYDFFVHIDKIKEIFKEKNNQYVPPLYKSSSEFRDLNLYRDCKKYFFFAINRRRLSAISDIYFFSKYLKNEPKTMSRHIDRLLMIPIFNIITTSKFLTSYRSQLVVQPFDFNRTYKSKSIFCGSTLCYTILANPRATYEQLCSSYSFKLRFFPDDESGIEDDADSAIKISGLLIKGCYDIEVTETDKIPPKAIYLDKNTLMNLLLHKFDYEHDNLNTTTGKERQKAVMRVDQTFNIEDEIEKEKSNFVLLRIDKLLNGLNLKSRQYNMSHFQLSNMTEYRDFFQRLVVLGTKNELYHGRKRLGEDPTFLLDPLAPYSNNKFFREAAASSKRETGSEKRIVVTNKQSKLPSRDYFKITINDPSQTGGQNDSQSSHTKTIPTRDWSRGRTRIENVGQGQAGREEQKHTEKSPNLTKTNSKGHLPIMKKLDEDDQLEKLSVIPHKERADLPSPSNRSGMSIYEGEEEIQSPGIGNNKDKNSKMLTRSHTNNIEPSEDREDYRQVDKVKVQGKPVEKYTQLIQRSETRL